MVSDFSRKVPNCPESIIEKNLEKWFYNQINGTKEVFIKTYKPLID